MINTKFGSIFLVAGTAIGAGMLALPIASSEIGFFLSMGLFVVIWYAMYLSSLLILETNLRLSPGANIVSMANLSLGVVGKVFASTTYLLLLYSLNIAYLSAVSDLLHSFLQYFFTVAFNRWSMIIILVMVMTSVVCLGTRLIDKLNRAFFFAMIITFFVLVATFGEHIALDNFTFIQFQGVHKVIPIITTAFGFHIIIPSIRNYIRSDIHSLKSILFIGSIIPLIVYIIWQIMIFGTLPISGDLGLRAILQGGNPITLSDALEHVASNSIIPYILNCFTFFIIVTSFIGVSLSIFDFLADAIGISKVKSGKFPIALLAFLPPLGFVLYDSTIFFTVLRYAGVLVAILLCILPALMSYYNRKSSTEMLRLTNNIELGLVFVFGIAVIVCECIGIFI